MSGYLSPVLRGEFQFAGVFTEPTQQWEIINNVFSKLRVTGKFNLHLCNKTLIHGIYYLCFYVFTVNPIKMLVDTYQSGPEPWVFP